MNSIYNLPIILSIISILLTIVSLYCTMKTKKRYEKLAIKLGNGEDISNILNKYITKVNEINIKDDQIIEYCNKIHEEDKKNIKKIGLVKYNLYNTTKNDLSFALALLNKNNDGIIINSIYGVDNSNVYCKEVNNGKCNNKLSSEEIEALKIAMNK